MDLLDQSIWAFLGPWYREDCQIALLKVSWINLCSHSREQSRSQVCMFPQDTDSLGAISTVIASKVSLILLFGVIIYIS